MDIDVIPFSLILLCWTLLYTESLQIPYLMKSHRAKETSDELPGLLVGWLVSKRILE